MFFWLCCLLSSFTTPGGQNNICQFCKLCLECRKLSKNLIKVNVPKKGFKNKISHLFVFHQIQDKRKVLPTEDKTELLLQASEAKIRKAPQTTVWWGWTIRCHKHYNHNASCFFSYFNECTNLCWQNSLVWTWNIVEKLKLK